MGVPNFDTKFWIEFGNFHLNMSKTGDKFPMATKFSLFFVLSKEQIAVYSLTNIFISLP
jgi:hypothetical protein